MASDETTVKTVHLAYDDEEEHLGIHRMSRLSIETSDGEDADGEMSDNDFQNKDDEEEEEEEENYFLTDGPISLPGTPGRAGPWAKEYASESEERGPGQARARRRRRPREGWIERAWEMKRSNSGSDHQCRVMVRPRGPDSGPICMDMDEVKACRELGLELPSDWTVEIPGGFSGVDTSSGGNSPSGNWGISSPGDDPRGVKARLKMWAQAVALASASSLSG